MVSPPLPLEVDRPRQVRASLVGHRLMGEPDRPALIVREGRFDRSPGAHERAPARGEVGPIRIPEGLEGSSTAPSLLGPRARGSPVRRSQGCPDRGRAAPDRPGTSSGRSIRTPRVTRSGGGRWGTSPSRSRLHRARSGRTVPARGRPPGSPDARGGPRGRTRRWASGPHRPPPRRPSTPPPRFVRPSPRVAPLSRNGPRVDSQRGGPVPYGPYHGLAHWEGHERGSRRLPLLEVGRSERGIGPAMARSLCVLGLTGKGGLGRARPRHGISVRGRLPRGRGRYSDPSLDPTSPGNPRTDGRSATRCPWGTRRKCSLLH